MIEAVGVPLLSLVIREHPKIQLRIREEGGSRLLGLLDSGEVELVLSPRIPESDSIVAELLFSEPLLIAYPPNYPVADGTDLKALARLPWITSQERNATRALVEAAFVQAGLVYHEAAEIEALSTMIRLVQHGLGVAILPQAVAAAARSRGGVKTTPFGSPQLTRPMFLCRRRSPELSKVGEFIAGEIRRFASEHRAAASQST
jgi:DNA-binding transcriptional LysR family regulator